MKDEIERFAYDWVTKQGLIVDYQVDVDYKGTSPYPERIRVTIKAVDPESFKGKDKYCKEMSVKIDTVSTDIYDCKNAPPR